MTKQRLRTRLDPERRRAQLVQCAIEVFAEHQDIIMTADGQTVAKLDPADRVTIRTAPRPVKLVNLQGLSFYELLRTKLNWSLADPATEDANGA